MGKRDGSELSRRERQIMDALYRMGRASVAEVLDEIPNPPGYSAVRAMLRVLSEWLMVVSSPSGSATGV